MSEEAAAAHPVDEVPWHQLHRLVIVVYALYGVGGALVALVPVVISLIQEGAGGWAWLAAPGALVLAGAIAGAGWFTWWITRYRVTPERVEKRSGILYRSYTSIPRDRVRTADLTANPVYQILGLSKVTVGTGQHAGSDQLVLDPVGREEAERLRAELLRRDAPATSVPGADDAAEAGGAAVPAGWLLASLNWSWARYAPLSVWVLLIGLVPFGLILQGAQWFSEPIIDSVLERQVWQLFESALLSALLIVPVVVIVVGAIGMLALFIEAWFNYRLEREPDGTLRVRRGLLTTRSYSLEERRLRGVDLSERLLHRWARAAQVDAIATGMGTSAQNAGSQRSTLLPHAPRQVADRVAALVVRADRSPTSDVALQSHPRAALRRRLVWLLTPTVVGIIAIAVAAQLVGFLPGWLWLPALLALPFTGALAVDAYRNLGHGITGDFLVTRYGTLNRHTVALQRAGVIGWNARQTIFQRRSGLVTLGATTAADHGVYKIRDADMSEGRGTTPLFLDAIISRKRPLGSANLNTTVVESNSSTVEAPSAPRSASGGIG